MIDAFFFGALGPWLRRHWWVWFPLSIAFFIVFPGVDLTISGWFWEPEKGWFWAKTPWAEFVRKKLPYFLIGSVFAAIALWGVFRLWGRTCTFLSGRVCAYLTLSLGIGPGLLANSLFKENWGRARPSQITQFGGTKTFTPPFEIADQCVSNCSFVSGHGALGLWVTAWAFICPPPWRGIVLLVTLILGSGVGFVRIAQGGHFFSDVFYAGVLVLAVNVALAAWFLNSSQYGKNLGQVHTDN